MPASDERKRPKHLIIIGAGGFGREVCAWAKTGAMGWTIRGFLDDNPQVTNDPRLRAPVLGPIDRYIPGADDVFVCAVGQPRLRQSMAEKIKKQGGRFATIIHPSALVADGAKVGEGVIVCPYALISVDATVGDGAIIYYHSSIDHDARVGPWSQISAHCDVTGSAVLGTAVFMGSHATVLPGIHVGDHAVIGAGAVVTKNVPPGAVVVGVPAQARSRNA